MTKKRNLVYGLLLLTAIVWTMAGIVLAGSGSDYTSGTTGYPLYQPASGSLNVTCTRLDPECDAGMCPAVGVASGSTSARESEACIGGSCGWEYASAQDTYDTGGNTWGGTASHSARDGVGNTWSGNTAASASCD